MVAMASGDTPVTDMRRRVRFTEVGSVTGAVGAAVTSAAAAVCCIGPLGLTLLGVNGMFFAAGSKPYRFYLLGLSAVMLGIAFLVANRDPFSKGSASCSTRSRRITRGVLWAAGIVWLGAFILQFIADKVTL